MESKKLEYTDIAEKNVFSPLIKEANELFKVLSLMKSELQAIAVENAKIAKQTPLNGYQNIEKVEKAISATKKATEELDKVEKERVRLQQKLKNLNDERAQSNANLKQQISERNRELKEEAKLNSANVTRYQKLSTTLGKLRKEYKDVALAQGRNSKAAKELIGEIVELSDSLEQLDRDVKQQFREIGRYEKALGGLKGTIGKLGAVGAVVQGFSALRDAFTANQQGADAVDKAIGRITITLRVFAQRVIDGSGAIFSIFQNLALSVKEFGLNVRLAFAQIPAFFGGAKDKVDELEASIAELNKQQEELSSQGLPELKKAFAGIGDEISETIVKNDKLIDSTTRLRKVAISLKEELTDLTKAQGTLQQAADDNTTSLEDQRKTGLDLLSINEQIAEKNIQIAKNEVSLARLRVETNKGSLSDREALTEALVALSEAETEAEVSRLETLTRIREIERDNIELDLDQLIDLADRRKTINESIAKDESLTLETRKEALSNALTDIESSFRKQSEKIQEGLKNTFNIDDLINEEDTVKLNERIKALGLDEIRQNRLREILQERIQATEDLRTAQDELAKSEEESREIQQDIIAQEQILAAINEGSITSQEALAKLEERRLELAIENLEIKIKTAEEGSIERLRLEQELNEKLLEQAENQAKDEVDIEKNKQKDIGKVAKEGFEYISDLSDSFFDKKIENIDKELESAEQREDQLRELAAQGNQDAQNSLAAEQKRRAELELQREQQLKRQKLAELQLAAIELFASSVSSGQSGVQALGTTTAGLTGLKALIEALPGFYEGSERVGDDLQAVLPGKDGHVIRVDGDERILPGHLNRLIPKRIDNVKLAEMASGKDHVGNQEFWRLGKKLDDVKSAIEKKPVYKGLDFDESRKAITWTIQQGNRITRKHKNLKSSVFG